MSKKQIGFWLLIIGVAVHVYGNAKKASEQARAGLTPSTNDMIYYGATAGLLLGVFILWGSIKSS